MQFPSHTHLALVFWQTDGGCHSFIYLWLIFEGHHLHINMQLISFFSLIQAQPALLIWSSQRVQCFMNILFWKHHSLPFHCFKQTNLKCLSGRLHLFLGFFGFVFFFHETFINFFSFCHLTANLGTNAQCKSFDPLNFSVSIINFTRALLPLVLFSRNKSVMLHFSFLLSFF